jgi:hypothetical protein
MTCREFIEAAESLTPLELRLMESKDETMSAHARECSGCGKWADSKRSLGNALQVLRAHTAQSEAGPKVELAVLEAFRTQGFEPVGAVAPDRAAPAVWKLSRFFEVGAYAAVAAALIVGIFLGARMWRDRQSPPAPVQAQVTSLPLPVNPQVTIVAGKTESSGNVTTEITPKSASTSTSEGGPFAAKRSQPAVEQAATTTVDRQGFVALMFCDPLICSGEEQVIRVELPGSTSASVDGHGNQPVIADVVVGDDGLVRAMRIVNP